MKKLKNIFNFEKRIEKNIDIIFQKRIINMKVLVKGTGL